MWKCPPVDFGDGRLMGSDVPLERAPAVGSLRSIAVAADAVAVPGDT